jgi:D-alanine transaminase
MDGLACLNGELMPVDQARIPIWDRGFLFGDAVYEVIRVYGGRCWLEAEHMARLRRGLTELEFPEVSIENVTYRVRRLLAASNVREGTVYIHVTRGVAPRRHAFPDPPVRPTELIVVRPYDDRPNAAMRETGVGVISYPDLRWKRCDVKSTNLLANVLANQAAHRAGCEEAVLVGADGLVTEASHSSVLWVRGGVLHGTPDGPGILPGTTRTAALRLAASIGLPFEEGRVSLDDLAACDEVVLMATTSEVMPVVTVDGRPVGGGVPGPVARRLQAAHREAVERWLATPPA